MSVTPESPRVSDPGAQPETVQVLEPPGNRRDLIAFLAVLGFAVIVLIVAYLAGGVAVAGVCAVPTAVSVCFGAWRAVRRREAPRRWRAGAFTYKSKDGRFAVARSWGTEGANAPALPGGRSDHQTKDPAIDA